MSATVIMFEGHGQVAAVKRQRKRCRNLLQDPVGSWEWWSVIPAFTGALNGEQLQLGSEWAQKV